MKTLSSKEFQAMKTKEYKDKLDAMNTSTKAAKARQRLGYKYLNNLNDEGRFGRVEELLSTTKYSNKIRVGLQGKPDTYIKWKNSDNVVTSRPIEVKTNGGRISDLIRRLENGKDTLIVYSLNICNSTTKGKPRVIEPVLMYFSEFYKMLKETNAIKNTNGRNPEIAIQPSSKKMYNRLLDYPIPYEQDTIYSEDDLEGLSL